MGLNALFRFFTKEDLRILMYHGLVTNPLPAFNWTSIDAKEFHWQMKYLAANYNVVRLEDVLSSEGNLPSLKLKHLTAITFDDGLRSVAEIAEAILEEFNFTATCFVNPGLSSGNDHIWTDTLYELIISYSYGKLDLTALKKEPLMFDDSLENKVNAIALLKQNLKAIPDIKRKEFMLALSGFIPSEGLKRQKAFDLMSRAEIINLYKKKRISVAAHTSTHPILARLAEEEQEIEIINSIRELEQWGIKGEKYFAYPNGQVGDFDESTVSLLKKHGIQYAFTSEEDFYNPDIHSKFMIPRMNIGADTGRDEFKAKVSGLYNFLMKTYSKIKKGKSWIKEMVVRSLSTILGK